MSPRQSVDRQRIRLFLEQLAGRFRRPARIYLVGGTTLVYEALREQSLDIDLVLETAKEHHAELLNVIRDLKDELGVNVEEASPGDFIPLPAGVESRHVFVDRFGKLEVFHFDLYSVSLSKIERGRTQDLQDVLYLLRAGKIEWNRLRGYFDEILPQMGKQSLKQDPADFKANFQALEALHGEP